MCNVGLGFCHVWLWGGLIREIDPALTLGQISIGIFLIIVVLGLTDCLVFNAVIGCCVEEIALVADRRRWYIVVAILAVEELLNRI